MSIFIFTVYHYATVKNLKLLVILNILKSAKNLRFTNKYDYIMSTSEV